MGHLDRYKKPGGFTQLLELIESFAPAKQEKFLGLIESENATWARALKERIITVSRITSWPPATLAEIVPHIPVNLMAICLHGFEKDKIDHFLSGLPASEKRKITTEYEIAKPNPNEIAATHNRLIGTVRKLIKEGDLRMDAVDPMVVVDEKTESKVINSPNSGKVPSFKPEAVPPMNATSSAPTTSNSTSNADLVDQAVREVATSGDAKAAQALVVSLQKENKALKAEIKLLKDKLEAIRKIA